MEEDKLRKIANEEMTKLIRENIDSALIFTYIKKLEEENKELEKQLEEKDMQHELELIGKEEYTKEAMGEIIEHYYTANENCIPKSVIEEMIEEIDNYGNTKHAEELGYRMKNNEWIIKSKAIELLRELLGKGNK